MHIGNVIVENNNRFLPIDPTTWYELDPKSIDAIMLTHTHNDHVWRMPTLINKGYDKSLFMTIQSQNVLYSILMDSINVQEQNIKREKEKNKSAKKNLYHNSLNPHFMGTWSNKIKQYIQKSLSDKTISSISQTLFTQEDVHKILNQVKSFPYYEAWNKKTLFKVFDDTDAVVAKFINAGHIFGSSMILFEITNHNKEIFSLLRTGDIGRVNNRIYGHPPTINDTTNRAINLIAIESTYAGKPPHPNIHQEIGSMIDYSNRIFQQWGRVIIPCFTQTRFQEMLLYLTNAKRSGTLPNNTEIIADSPLAKEILSIMNNYDKNYTDLNTSIKRLSGNEIVKTFLDWEEQKNVIFVLSGGMLEWWTIMKLVHYLDQLDSKKMENFNLELAKKSGIIMSGYLPEWSLWDKILKHPTQYNAHKITLSSHSDHNGIVDFITNAWWNSGVHIHPTWKVYLMHGELNGMKALKESLEGNKINDNQIIIPSNNSSTYQFTL